MRKAINIALLVIALIFSVVHIRERIILHKFMQEYLGSHKTASSFEEVQAIRDTLFQVIDDGNRNKRLEHFDLSKRPKWGYSLSFILKYREAQCAGFTRLLYHVLGQYGIESRPVILYGIKGNQHSVVEYRLKGKWYLLDTNNAPKGLNEFYQKQRKSILDYAYEPNEMRMAPLINMPYFQLYSYFNVNRFTYPLHGYNTYITKPLSKTFIFLYNNLFLTFALMVIALFLLVNGIFYLARHPKLNAR